MPKMILILLLFTCLGATSSLDVAVEIDATTTTTTTTSTTTTTTTTLYTLPIFTNLQQWIKKHRSRSGGIIISTGKRVIYPEVTGYYIPTLLEIGEHNLAEEFGTSLVAAQHDDGSFGLGGIGFVFDTAMVVRGLNALVRRSGLTSGQSKFVRTLNKACSWLTQAVDPETGRWIVPSGNIWGLPSGRGRVSEGIHLLGILPLRQCGLILKKDNYVVKSYAMEKLLLEGLTSHELKDFTLRHHLSHFYAYIMEALQELGHYYLVRDGMEMVSSFQKLDGSVPAYFDVDWVCTTGLAQLALVWYRMGDVTSVRRADAALGYLLGGGAETETGVQNKETHGFTGSVGVGATYFPYHEISWSIKYTLDALLSIPVAHFNHAAIETFPTFVNDDDDRLQYVIQEIQQRLLLENKNKENKNKENKEKDEKEKENGETNNDEASGDGMPPIVLDVLDVGCGKGRFVQALKRNDILSNHIRMTGTDISIDMLKTASSSHDSTPLNTFVRSSATSLPFPDESFDVVYMIESMEHVLFIDETLRECRRVLKNHGVLIVIDKTTDDLLGRHKLWTLEPWEQWFGIRDMSNRISQLLGDVSARRLEMDDGLFVAWRGSRNIMTL